jgi:hypothetical protein
MYRKTIVLGKIAYSGDAKNNEVELEIDLSVAGRLAIVAHVWNSRKTDLHAVGQMHDEIQKYFGHDPKVKRILEVWKRWHLNTMRAGSPAQEDFLRQYDTKGVPSTYEMRCVWLKRAGLNPDPNYLIKGKPYEYGHAWLREELPQDVIDEIKSW